MTYNTFLVGLSLALFMTSQPVLAAMVFVYYWTRSDEK